MSASYQYQTRYLASHRIVFIFLTFLILSTIFLYVSNRSFYQGFLSDIPTLSLWPQPDEPCQYWDPWGDPADDPEGCMRARQFRQIQQLFENSWDKEVYQALDHLEKCALGLLQCPPRPLILSSWFFMWHGIRGGTSGEEVWMRSVAEAIWEEGFAIVVDFRESRAVWLSHQLSESLHMFMLQDIYAFECTTNPRCIRPDDYHPADDPLIRHDLSQIAEEDMGTVPLFRIFATTYWGARPTTVGAPGIDGHSDWDLNTTDIEWSYNPLGRHHVITLVMLEPAAAANIYYRTLTLDMPGSRTRLSGNVIRVLQIPHAERNNSILILAKHSDLFDRRGYTDLMHHAWPETIATMADFGLDFMAAATVEKGVEIPAGITNLGSMPRQEYQDMLSGVKAFLGIHQPEISPSPYLSLCRGVPAVMPYRGPTPTPEGWYLYDLALVQHGPVNTIGEPWVYTYDLDDMDDMIAKLKRAASTPIAPYVPPDYSEESVRTHTRKVLYYDYEGHYNEMKRANGGVTPHHPLKMLKQCFVRDRCKLGPTA